MKTLFKTNKLKYIVILFLIITSCETDIPETDTTPPTFSIKIDGDGFDRTFTQDDNFESIQLNLKTGVEYNILFSGNDQGGVKLVQLQYAKDYINFTTDINAPWTDNSVSALSNMLTWQGDSNNPLTAGIFGGKFVTSGVNIGTDFKIFVRDFGGEGGSSNSVSKQLNIYIGNHNTEVINL